MHDLQIFVSIAHREFAIKGRSKFMESETKARLVELCLHHQLERNPVIIDNAIEFMRKAAKQVKPRAKFVVEWKMIIVCSLKFRSIQSENEIDHLIVTPKV
jgi:hypothetical protein